MTNSDPTEGRPVPPSNEHVIEEALGYLFGSLESHGVRYAALRVSEEVLRPGQEIDILVAPGSLRALLDAIYSLCVRFPTIKVAYWRELPRHAATVILTWREEDGSWTHYFFDIRCGIYKQSHLLFDGGELDGDVTTWDSSLGLRRMRDDLECALLMIRNVLDGREKKTRHDWILRNRWTEDVPETVHRLGFSYDSNDRGEGEPSPGKRSTRDQLRKFRYGARALYGRARQRGGGTNIVLYGPDGVGKSTQAGRVAEFFRRVGVRPERIGVYHAFRRIETLGKGSAGAPASLKRAAYKGARRQATRVLLLVAGFMKRLIIYHLIFQPRARRGVVQVHDRYFLDVFLKFFKTHDARLPAVERALSSLAPRGDTLVVLRADPEVVSGRTGELSPPEVAATYELLDACLGWSRTPSDAVHDVDANLGPDDVFDFIVDGILCIQTRTCLARTDVRLPVE